MFWSFLHRPRPYGSGIPTEVAPSRDAALLLHRGLSDDDCARVVVATFSEQNSAAASVRGTVTFTQTDADADVEIQIALTGLEHGGQDGNSWHVHEWPVTGQDCGNDSVSGHYNPAAQCVEAASVSVDADREACAAVTALETAGAVELHCRGVPHQHREVQGLRALERGPGTRVFLASGSC